MSLVPFRRPLRVVGYVVTLAAVVHWVILASALARDDRPSSTHLSYQGGGAGGSIPHQIGRVFVDFVMDDGTFNIVTCTASVVSHPDGDPGNGSVVLTAAHCFEEVGSTSIRRAWFTPGFDVDPDNPTRAVEPEGRWPLAGYVSGWDGNVEKSRSDDIAFALVCPGPTGRTVADAVGSFTVVPNLGSTGLWTTIGYPRTDTDASLVGPTIVHSEGSRIGNSVTGFRRNSLRLNAASDVVASGMSGAPVLLDFHPDVGPGTPGRNLVGHVVSAMGGGADRPGSYEYYRATGIDDRAWSDFLAVRSVDPAGHGPWSVAGLDCDQASADANQ